MAAVLLVFLLSAYLLTGLSAGTNGQEKRGRESKPIYIPKEVKAVFEQGMPAREARPDIPFAIHKILYFPAGPNLHATFLFKVKNSDLGFAPLTPTTGKEEKKKKEKEEEALTAFESVSAKLQAKCHVFLQVNRIVNNAPAEVVSEIYVPMDLEVDSSDYQPDKEEIYSAGYPIPPGNYLLAMAIASQKLEKIGAQYYEFSLPDAATLTDKIDTTPIFFLKNFQRTDAPETRPIIHKGFFTYSVLQIEPNFDALFSPGDSIEVLFYVFGAQPNQANNFVIEVTYEVLKGEEKIIRYAPGNYEQPVPLIGQPLPLERRVLVKSETEEKEETRKIEPGTYALSMVVTDKTSGKSIAKAINFEVR